MNLDKGFPQALPRLRILENYQKTTASNIPTIKRMKAQSNSIYDNKSSECQFSLNFKTSFKTKKFLNLI